LQPLDGDAAFDQIVVGGNLAINGATTLRPVFNAPASDIDGSPASTVTFSDPFWSTGHVWSVIQVAGQVAGFGNLSLANITLDSAGAPMPQSRFSLIQGSDGDNGILLV
jgi:hypothetical protein